MNSIGQVKNKNQVFLNCIKFIKDY